MSRLKILIIPIVVIGVVVGAIFYKQWHEDPRRALEDFVYGAVRGDPERAFEALDQEKVVICGHDYGYDRTQSKNLNDFRYVVERDIKEMPAAGWLPPLDQVNARVEAMQRIDGPDPATAEFVDKAKEPETHYVFHQVDGKWKLLLVRGSFEPSSN